MRRRQVLVYAVPVLLLALAGERSIYWKLTGRENLAMIGELHHLGRATARRTPTSP